MVVRDALRSIKNNEPVSLDQVLSKMLGDSFLRILARHSRGLISDRLGDG